MKSLALLALATLALFGAAAFALEKPDYKTTNPSRKFQSADAVCAELKAGSNKDREGSFFRGQLAETCNGMAEFKQTQKDQEQAAMVHYSAGALCMTECVGIGGGGGIKMCKAATMAAQAFNQQKAQDAQNRVQGGFGAPGAFRYEPGPRSLEPSLLPGSRSRLLKSALALVETLSNAVMPSALAADGDGGGGGDAAGSAGGGDKGGGQDNSSACMGAATNLGMGIQKQQAAGNAKSQAQALGKSVEDMAQWPEPQVGSIVNMNTKTQGQDSPFSRQAPEDTSSFLTKAKARCNSGDPAADRLCMAALEDLSGSGNGAFNNVLKERTGLSLEDLKALQKSGKSGGEIASAIGQATGAGTSQAGASALAEAKQIAEKSREGQETKVASYSGGGSGGLGGSMDMSDPLAGLGDSGHSGSAEADAMRFLAKENGNAFQAGKFTSQQISPLFVAVTARYRAKIIANDLPNE